MRRRPRARRLSGVAAQQRLVSRIRCVSAEVEQGQSSFVAYSVHYNGRTRTRRANGGRRGRYAATTCLSPRTSCRGRTRGSASTISTRVDVRCHTNGFNSPSPSRGAFLGHRNGNCWQAHVEAVLEPRRTFAFEVAVRRQRPVETGPTTATFHRCWAGFKGFRRRMAVRGLQFAPQKLASNQCCGASSEGAAECTGSSFLPQTAK